MRLAVLFTELWRRGLPHGFKRKKSSTKGRLKISENPFLWHRLHPALDPSAIWPARSFEVDAAKNGYLSPKTQCIFHRPGAAHANDETSHPGAAGMPGEDCRLQRVALDWIETLAATIGSSLQFAFPVRICLEALPHCLEQNHSAS